MSVADFALANIRSVAKDAMFDERQIDPRVIRDLLLNR